MTMTDDGIWTCDRCKAKTSTIHIDVGDELCDTCLVDLKESVGDLVYQAAYRRGEEAERNRKRMTAAPSGWLTGMEMCRG